METYKNYKKHFFVSLFMMLSLCGWSDSLTGYVGEYIDLPEPAPPSSALEIHVCNFYIDDSRFNISKYLQVVGHKVYISKYFDGQLPVTVDVWYRRKDNGRVITPESTFYHYVTCRPVELSGFPTVGLNMEVGERKTIDWSCSPSSRLPYVNLNWTSSNNNIVSVDNYGELTAKSAGDAVITVENNAGPDKSFNVSVMGGSQPAPSPIMIVLPNYTETIKVGQKITLKPVISPTNAETTLTWSSNSTVATVTQDGVVEGIKVGEAKITVTTSNGKSAFCYVKVEANTIEATGISVLPEVKTIKVGESFTANYTLEPSNATTTVTWYSDDTSIATVTSSGKVTGVKAGTTYINAKTANGKEDWCKVTVEANTVLPTGIEVAPTSKTIKVGDSFTASYTLEPSNATTTVTWYSDDSGIASVSSSGKVTGVSPGTTYINAKTANGKEDWCKVSVEAKTVEPMNINISPASKTIKVGESFTATYSLEPSNATTTVTWYSDDSGIASVSSSGKVTGVSPGTTYINAKTANGKEDWCRVTVEDNSDGVVSVAGGFDHSLIVKKDGSLWSCGSNGFGQLGDGTTTNRHNPVKIMSDVSTATAGGWNSFIVKKDGSLWACGDNYAGQLGDGTTTVRHSPVKIMNGVVSVAASEFHIITVKKDGSLWTCGENLCGQLGDGTKTYKLTPVKILDEVASVAAGGPKFIEGSLNHSLIVKKDGSLWACGSNDFGQLGDGTTKERDTPVKIMEGVAQVAAGSQYTLIVKKDGSLWSCGYNYYGCLGDGTTTERHNPVKIMDDVASVAAGAHHSLMVRKDGTLWACGSNNYGQLGDGTTTDRHIPIKIMDGVASVAAGEFHTLIVKKDGTLWACGNNKDGKIGDGTTTDRHTPVQISLKTVGISDMKKQSPNDGSIYNLNGQRVTNPKKGVYIRDGKKVLMR